ncbi:MAG: ABC transporter ATP-binding protein [Candidatus Eremiobacteraeota bacterium]|nr:ABC transporter ATP-binding protein [Candidatus Eremiobacteraeota bacterium]
MNNNDKVIHTERLTKLYGKNVGIWGLDLEVKKGEVFGFLGPNGAGKTTTINILLDLVRPTRGKALVFGMDSHKEGKYIRSLVGYIPGQPGFYEEMTGRAYLNFFAGLKGYKCSKKIDLLAERFFQIKLERKIKAYSRGMKQLLYIIQAFMGDPDLYILDEPTSNLDPIMKRAFQGLVEEEHGQGKTVFLSSHKLEEVERLCDRVCIIRNGEMVALNTIEEIQEKMRKIIDVKFESPIPIEKLKVDGVTSVKRIDELYTIEVTGEINPILARLSEMPIRNFDYHKMSLEEIFLEYFEENGEPKKAH